MLAGGVDERVDGDAPRDELAVARDLVGQVGGHDVDARAAADGVGAAPDHVDAIRRRRSLDAVGAGCSPDRSGGRRRRHEQRERREQGGLAHAHELTVAQPDTIRLLAQRGGRRFSEAISEGDGISVIVDVDALDAARAAQTDGAEAIVVRRAIAGLRDATELPILWYGSGTLDDADRAGADAVLIAADGDEDDDEGRLEQAASRAAELGLDLVVSVTSEEQLERVLESHDPGTFHLASTDLEQALELLTDVPVGKLAIAEASQLTREQVVELERRGFDAVIVPALNVAELVGGAPPAV